jgi:hypothetical protein
LLPTSFLAAGRTLGSDRPYGGDDAFNSLTGLIGNMGDSGASRDCGLLRNGRSKREVTM